MNRPLIFGGGTLVTIAAKGLEKRLDPATWKLSAVGRSDPDHYEPGQLWAWRCWLT